MDNKNKNKNFTGIYALLQLMLIAMLPLYMIISGKLSFQVDMLSLLPKSNSQVQQAEEAFFERYKDNVVITMSGQHSESVYDEISRFAENKNWHNAATGNVPAPEQVFNFYLEYQGALLSFKDKASIDNQEPLSDGIIEKLTQTMNPVVQGTFNEDPSLTVASFIEESFSLSDAPSLKGGRLTKHYQGQDYLIQLLRLPSDAESINQAQVYAGQVLELIQSLQVEYSDTEIRYSGIVFHTAENAKQASFEMTVFGSLSFAAMLLLVWFVFSNMSACYAVVLTMSNAIIYGVAGLSLLFEEVHLISFIFGVTLIGIAIDYCFHILSSLTQERDSEKSLIATKKAILIGFLSTAAGYLLFLLTSLTLFYQIAVFIVFGLLGALVMTFVFVPKLANRAVIQSNILIVAGKLTNYLISKSRHILALVSFLLLASALSAWQLTEKFNDNLGLLTASSEQLIANEAFNNELLSGESSSRVLLIANEVQTLLEMEEALLASLKKASLQMSYTGASLWLPSLKQQKQNNLVLSLAANDGKTFDGINTLLNRDIQFENTKLLTYENALLSPIAKMVDSSLLATETLKASLLTIHNIDKTTVDYYVAQNDNAYVLDKNRDMSELMKLSRESLIQWMLLASLGFVVILFVKFDLHIAAKSALILSLVSVLSLLLSIYLQGPLNIFNVLALILILALAIDYLVFYASKGITTHNVLAVSLSAISSSFVFGVLILSKTPAIFSFGLTITVGILSIYILSPMVVRNRSEH